MDNVKRLLFALSLTFLGGWCAQLIAGEYGHREQGVHQHGVGGLNVAVEADAVHFELITPAANIVGFEHAPRHAEEEAALRAAVEKLKAGDELFSLSPGARCELAEADVRQSPMMRQDAATQGAGHGGEHEQHEAHEAHDHTPKDSSHGHSSDNAAREQHEETHSEFQVTYQFNCRNPAALEHIDVNLFSLFPATERLRAQVVSGSAQRAFDLTPTATRIGL